MEGMATEWCDDSPAICCKTVRQTNEQRNQYYRNRSFHIYLVGNYPTVPMFPQPVIIVTSPSHEAFHLMHIPGERSMLPSALTATGSMNGEDGLKVEGQHG